MNLGPLASKYGAKFRNTGQSTPIDVSGPSLLATMIKCSFCGRDNFASERGLSQHLKTNAACARAARNFVVGRVDSDKLGPICMPWSEVFRPSKSRKVVDDCVFTGLLAQSRVPVDTILRVDQRDPTFISYNERGECYEDDNGDMFYVDDNSSANGGGVDSDGELLEDDSSPPDFSIQANYNEYRRNFGRVFMEEFTANEAKAIKLMNTLRQTKASLDTYEAVMKWHVQETGEIQEHEGLGASKSYISRKSLFKFLRKRYNIHPNSYNVVREITLPSSKAKARIVLHDARAVIQSLLTDPRIRDEDYLFFNNDPFSPPPADLDYIGDLNTGLAYSETYAQLITKPDKQVLLPVPIYIDGAVTGQFKALNVEAVKFTLGILTRKARDRPELWRTLGYLPTTFKLKSRGRRMMVNSGHSDGQQVRQNAQNALNDEGITGGEKVHAAQDLHTMLAVIFESFLPLQQNGFLWDLVYRGKTYKDVEFVPFVPFIKCDTEEADKLCGKYLSRGRGVKNLCRYCECPNVMTDRPTANYPRKTVTNIASLVEKKDLKGLKDISQQCINNSMYLLRFGLHNDEGVHGGCPMEMLHAILLGMFMYTRDGFFIAIGESSQTAEEINALAVQYGEFFARQSDRDMPKTKFSEGITKGKIQAKEFSGILLVIAAVLRSTIGREHLKKAKSDDGVEMHRLRDWTLLVETLLQWEAWLKSDKMSKSDVRRSEIKHRYIMYLIRKVSKRMKGMGLKIMKYHGISHMAQDIENFGVPMEYDTGSNESGHKPTKAAAKLTQKRPETFDEQLAERLVETFLLELATEELLRGNKIWNYDLGYNQHKKKTPTVNEPYLGGTQFGVHYDEETEQNRLYWKSRVTGQGTVIVEQGFVDFVATLQEKTSVLGLNSVLVYSTHHRKGLIFRGTASHSGEVWRDWVLVDWGDDYGELPCKIWGFLDLRELPDNNDIKIGGLTGVPPAMYAIVESSQWVEDETEVGRSEIFVPIIKDVREIRDKKVTKMRFYLADVEAFADPCVVVPDLGGKPNDYFLVKKRKEWREDFVVWLRDDHEDISDDEDDGSLDEDGSSDQGDWDSDGD